MMSRVFLRLLLPFAAFMMFFGCQCSKKTPQQDANSQKHTITIGISQEPDSLFAPFKEMMASEEVYRVGNATLTIFDENWRIVPWAAKEIPTLENGKLELFKEGGKQKMRTTWELRDDFYWADGKPLIADDFVFAHEINKDPNQEIIDRSVTEKIEKMESKGPNHKTLVVTWREPYAYYHNYRQHEPLPKHIVEPIYRATPDKLKKHAFGQAPMLAGPFTIKEWSPGSHIVAVRNPFAKDGLKPKFDEVVWKIIPQTNTLESNLVSGTIDAISTIGLDLDQAMQFEERHKDKFDFFYTPGLVWEHIDFNLDNDILKDKRVRQALAMGADRERIAQQLFHGKQPVAHGTEPPKSPYYNDQVKKYSFNQTESNRLLEEAGWVRTAPDAIRTKNGQPLKLVVMSTAGNKTRERVQQLLQAEWKEIGVDVEIKNQPAKVFFGETLRKRQFPHMALYAWIKDPLAVSDTMWRCDYIPSKANNFMGQNQSGWCNKKADELLKAATQELDEQKRIQIAKQFEALWADELPSLPLFFRVDVSVTKKGLQNWKPTGILQPVTWNVQDWNWRAS